MIVALVFAGIFSTIALLWGIWIILKSSVSFSHNKRDMRLFEIDPNKRKVRIIPNTSTKFIFKCFYKGNRNGKWEGYETLINSFKNSDGEAEFRNALHTLSRKKEVNKVSFNFEVYHRERLTFRKVVTKYWVVMGRINKSSLINTVIKYNTRYLSLAEKEGKNNIITTQEEVIKLDKEYKGFVSFLIFSKQKDHIKEIADKISKLYSGRRKVYISNNIISLISQSNKSRWVRRKVKQDISLFNKKSLRIGISHDMSGSATIYGRDINTILKLNKLMRTQEYFLSISSKNNIPFVSKDSEIFNLEEYRQFMEESSDFRSAVKSYQINPKICPVRRVSSDRKVIDFICPEVESISPSVSSLLFENIEYKRMLTNAAATKFATTMIIKKPFMIDVCDDWLFSNYKEIEQKKGIYIINVLGTIQIEDFIRKTEEITNAGINIAVRVKVIDNNMRSIIKRTNIKFIILDEVISKNVNNANILTRLLPLKKLANDRGIKFIFEEPDIKREKEWLRKIGLELYYSKNN